MNESDFPLGLRYSTAASNLYATEGPDGVSLRKLARQLQVSPSALYRHFPTKDRLLGALAGSAYVVLNGYIDRHSEVRPARAWLALVIGMVALHRANVLDEQTVRRMCIHAASRMLLSDYCDACQALKS